MTQADPRCPGCGMPRTRADVYCKYCGCEFDGASGALLEDFFRRSRSHRGQVAARIVDMRAQERTSLLVRFALVIGLLVALVAVNDAVRCKREIKERDSAFASAIAAADKDHPTEQAIASLRDVAAKYPLAQQSQIARRLLGDLTAKQEQERSAVERAIASARGYAGIDAYDRALAILAAALNENPDAPNLGDAAQASANIRNLFAQTERREREDRARERAATQRELAAQRRAEQVTRSRQAFEVMQNETEEVRRETRVREAAIEDMRRRARGEDGGVMQNGGDFEAVSNPRGINY